MTAPPRPYRPRTGPAPRPPARAPYRPQSASTTRPRPVESVRAGGGVYVYRTRKPTSLLGLLRLPFRWLAVAALVACGLLELTGSPWWLGLILLFATGRHFGYVGETVTFRDRHAEHLHGGGRWRKPPSSWSDLDPVCVLRIPLPHRDRYWLGARVFRAKALLWAIEAALILLLAPVYNDTRNRLNLRRIPLESARRMRARRNGRRIPISWFNVRVGHVLGVAAVVVLARAYGLV